MLPSLVPVEAQGRTPDIWPTGGNFQAQDSACGSLSFWLELEVNKMRFVKEDHHNNSAFLGFHKDI